MNTLIVQGRERDAISAKHNRDALDHELCTPWLVQQNTLICCIICSATRCSVRLLGTTRVGCEVAATEGAPYTQLAGFPHCYSLHSHIVRCLLSQNAGGSSRSRSIAGRFTAATHSSKLASCKDEVARQLSGRRCTVDVAPSARNACSVTLTSRERDDFSGLRGVAHRLVKDFRETTHASLKTQAIPVIPHRCVRVF